MAYKRVFDKNFESLTKILPMNDALFIAKLTGNGLLPADVGSHIKEMQSTRAEKATYFLDNVIKPSIEDDDVDDDNDFSKLISVMEISEFTTLKKKAAKMKSELNEGTYVLVLHLT